MIYFSDTSAFFKKYLTEEGSDSFSGIWEEAKYIFISVLTELELISSIEIAKRIRRIHSPEYREAMQSMERDLAKMNLTKVEMDSEIIQKAKRYIKLHCLRAPDAIQLATAILTSQKLGGGLTFLCADQPLLDAARLERLPCVDVWR